MRRPKSRPSSAARSCSRPISPSRRRLSSSSCESRPAVPTESTATEITKAMITTTTRISTRVKPLLRMGGAREPGPGPAWRSQPGLFVVEARAADVRVVAIAARLAVPAQRDDLIILAVARRARVLVDTIPWVLREGRQVTARAVVGQRGIVRLGHQRLQPLLRGRVLEVVEPVQVERRLDGADVGLGASHSGLVHFVDNIRHHERA